MVETNLYKTFYALYLYGLNIYHNMAPSTSNHWEMLKSDLSN